MTTEHRLFSRLTAATTGSVLVAIACVIVASAASLASAASIINFRTDFGPTQSADYDDYSALRYRFAESARSVTGRGAIFGTATNIVSIINGPETHTADLTGDVVISFDVDGAAGAYTVLIRVTLDGDLTTFNDGFVEGNNGQAFASMSNISVTDLAGLNLVIASATTRGPTTQSGTTPVNVFREFSVTGTPAQNHHELRFRWTTRCQSIVAGLIGNGVMCEARFGYGVDLVGGQIRLTPKGGGRLLMEASLVGTPTPTPTRTPTSTPTPTPTRTPTRTPTPLPRLSIHDTSVVEGNAGTRSMVFAIDVDTSHTVPITARFATANTTATAGSDYTAVSTTVSLPAGTNQITASVPVLGDTRREGNETFIVVLGHPTNATIALGQATGTIVDDESVVGVAELVSGDGVVAAGETVPFTLRWTHPGRWRDLNTVDLRLIDNTGAVFWGRFTEGADAFSLCDGGSCSGSIAPGVGDPINTGASTFHPASSVVQGSGATGPSVDLTFAVSLDESVAGHTFRIEAAATGDNGDEQPFETVGTLIVAPDSDGGGGNGCQLATRGSGAPSGGLMMMAGLALMACARARSRRSVTR